MEEDLSFDFRPRFHLSFITNFSFDFCPVHLTAFDPSRISKKKIALAKFVSSKNHWWKREEVLCVHRCQIAKFIFDFSNKNISAPSEKFDHWPHFIWLDRFILKFYFNQLIFQFLYDQERANSRRLQKKFIPPFFYSSFFWN